MGWILLFAFVAVLILVVIVACETYALSNPNDRFSVWWRSNIMDQDTDNRFD